MPSHNLTWGFAPNMRVGSIREYIEDCYPAYAALGLFTWEEIAEHLKTLSRAIETKNIRSFIQTH